MSGDEVSVAPAGAHAPAPTTLVLPSDLDLAALKPALAALSLGENLSDDHVKHPDATLILRLYQALSAKWPELQRATQERDAAVAQAQQREAEVDALLNESEAARQNALARAREADSQCKVLAQSNDALRLELNAAQDDSRADQGTLNAHNDTLRQLEEELRESHADKRNLAAMFSKAKDANAEMEHKCNELESEVTRLRAMHAQFVSDLAASRSAEQQQKYTAHSAEQKLSLAQRDAEWANAELNRATQAAATYRASKSTEVLRLQTQLDKTEQELSSLQTKLRYESNLRSSTEEREAEAQAKIEELSRRLATQEATFSSETAAQNKRIAQLQRISEDAAAREKGLEETWQESVRESEEREAALQVEIDQGFARVAEIEAEKQDLQEAMDRLAASVGIETDLANRACDNILDDTSVATSVAGSVSRSHFGPNHSSILSPSASAARKVRKSGKSFSDMYVEHARTQEELRRERIEVARLNQVLESVFEELREKEPALEAQRKETDDLRSDLEETSAALATLSASSELVNKDRDQLRLDRDRLKSEIEMTTQQLEDLGRQVRALTKEIILRDDPAAAERMEEDGTVFPPTHSISGDLLPVAAPEEEEGTQAIITNELVTFSSLTGLLAQNQRLLRVVRDLASRVESREDRLHDSEEVALAQAAEDLERLQARLEEVEEHLEAVTQERDMFRDLVQSRESRHAPTAADDTVVTRPEESLAALQSHFADFKAEAKRDYDTLRQEVLSAQAKATSKAVEAASERTLREGLESRLKSLEASSMQQRQRLEELTAFNASLQSQVVGRDAELRRKESETVDLRATFDSLSREAGHLRSEVAALRSSDARLTSDNQSLVAERASLSELLKSLTGTQQEMEAAAAAHRTRLESQVARLEREVDAALERAAKADEEVRVSGLRARVDAREAQMRTERLSADLATAQKNCAVANSTVDNLRTREEELQNMLASARTTIGQLERSLHPTQQPTAEPDAPPATPGGPASGTPLYDAQVADLRASLSSVQAQAEAARAQVLQYQTIAQTTEETLQSLQQTYDEYRSGTESILADKQNRVDSLVADLASAKEQLAQAQAASEQAGQELAMARAQFAMEKRELQDTLTQLDDVETRAAGEHAKVQADVEAQLEEARAAHSKYETELLLHAEDLQALNEAKAAIADAETSSHRLQAKVNELQVALDMEKQRAASQNASVEQERSELTKRISDLTEQNVVLHNSLQSLTASAPAFVAPNLPDTASEGTAAPTEGTAVEDFASVIKYLRREKEVADLQLDLAKQEVIRLRSSLEVETTTSDELRAQLVEERAKAVASSAGSGKAGVQSELLARTNELAIVRESNTALREESERLSRKVNQLQADLSAAQTELEPLQEKARLSEVEVQASQASLKLVQEDNARWQARAQSILQQYNQVDPEELQQALERAAKAEADLATATANLAAAEARAQTVQSERETAIAAERTRLENEKNSTLASKDTELAEKDKKFEQLRLQTIERLRTSHQQSGQLRAEIESLKHQLVADNKKHTDEASHSAEQAKDQLEAVTREFEAAKAEVDQLNKDKSSAEASLAEVQAKVASLEDQIASAAASSDETAAAERQKAWDSERTKLTSDLEELKAKEAELTSQLDQANARANTAGSATEELAKLKAAHAMELSKLNEQRDATIEQRVSEKLAVLTARSSEEGTTEENGGHSAVATLQARITDLEAQLKTAHEAAQERDASTTLAAETEARLRALETELAEAKQTIQQSAQQQTATVQAAVRKSNEVASSAIKTRDTEIESLRKELVELRSRPTADSSAGAADPDKVEAEVKARLEQLEASRAMEQENAIKAAVEAKEKELDAQKKAATQDAHEAGRKEAELKNKLLLLKRDKTIDDLRSEVTRLQGQTGTPEETTSPSVAASKAAAGRVGGITRGATPVGLRGRGGRAGAASGRGGSALGGKRKASEETTTSTGDQAKKPRGGGGIQVNRPTIRRPGQQNNGQS